MNLIFLHPALTDLIASIRDKIRRSPICQIHVFGRMANMTAKYTCSGECNSPLRKCVEPLAIDGLYLVGTYGIRPHPALTDLIVTNPGHDNIHCPQSVNYSCSGECNSPLRVLLNLPHAEKTYIMRSLFIGLLALIMTQTATAQFGVSVLHQSSQDGYQTSATPNGGTFGSGFEVGADYWFRLKNKRIEFLPTFSYGRYAETYPELRFAENIEVAGSGDFSFTSQQIGFQFKTNFYLLDFGTDCDCPTFGKQGPALHKGFFVQLAPGILYQSLTANYTAFAEEVKENQFIPTVSLGLGLDFGVSNLITITPLVSYRFALTEQNWNGLYPERVLNPFLENDLPARRSSALQAGIRLGIRLDERRY